MYYYGARYYDPRISIFVSVDPLAEQTMEPYLYTGNNPIMFTDPTGMSKEGLEHDPPGGGNDRPFGQANYEQKPTINILQTSSVQLAEFNVQGGYPGQALDELITAGIQWLGGKITSTDVSKETSENIQFATSLTIAIVSKGKNPKAGAEVIESVVKSETKAVSSRAARREVMRKEGIPTSQQPISQSKNSSGREYMYETPKAGGGTRIKSVQQQTLDRSHKGQPHWEAGTVKSDNGTIFTNRYGRPKLTNNKSKVDY